MNKTLTTLLILGVPSVAIGLAGCGGETVFESEQEEADFPDLTQEDAVEAYKQGDIETVNNYLQRTTGLDVASNPLIYFASPNSRLEYQMADENQDGYTQPEEFGITVKLNENDEILYHSNISTNENGLDQTFPSIADFVASNGAGAWGDTEYWVNTIYFLEELARFSN